MRLENGDHEREMTPPKGLPEVLITLDPETPENAGFRFGTFGKGRAINAIGGLFEFYVLQRGPVGEHPFIGRGSWRATWMKHEIHGWCYQLLNVDGRTAILIHAANWFQELLGCLAFGAAICDVVDVTGRWLGKVGAKQMGVMSSGPTVARFNAHMDQKDFMLTIV